MPMPSMNRPGKSLPDVGGGGRRLRGLVRPDVEDAGRGYQRRGCFEDWSHVLHARRAADPPGAVSELLEELRGLARALAAERPVAGPDADLAEVDGAHAIASEVEMSR